MIYKLKNIFNLKKSFLRIKKLYLAVIVGQVLKLTKLIKLLLCCAAGLPPLWLRMLSCYAFSHTSQPFDVRMLCRCAGNVRSLELRRAHAVRCAGNVDYSEDMRSWPAALAMSA